MSLHRALSLRTLNRGLDFLGHDDDDNWFMDFLYYQVFRLHRRLMYFGFCATVSIGRILVRL